MSARAWLVSLGRLVRGAMIALTLGIPLAAQAGGSLSVSNQQPVVYANGGASLKLNLDQGPFGSRSNAQAVTLIQNAIGLWNGVGTSTLRLGFGPQLSGDYTGANWANIVGKYNDGLNPVVFDTDGSITDALFGAGAKNNILGFAGSAYSGANYVEGEAVLNGYLSVSDATWTVVFAHEIGHFFGLDHSQLDGAQGLAMANYVLMYPIAYRTLLSLHEDDAAAVTSLYPSGTMSAQYGQLTGTFTTAGGTPILGANIWAKENSTGLVYSVVSDFLLQGSGYFRLYLRPGTYTLHAESIRSNFTGGSGVGPYAYNSTDISFKAPHPITPVALGGGTPRAITISAGCVATATFRLDGAGNVTGNCSGGAQGPTTTAVAGSPNPSPYGAALTLTATVTGTAPTGTVAFTDGGATISGCAAVALTGSGNTRTAACSANGLSAGTHAIVASYGGDAGNAGSQGNLTETVQPQTATLALSSSSNPSAAGAAVTYTATVTGIAPTGNVAFTDGGATISGCAAVALTGSGNARSATCGTGALSAGSHPIAASYGGNAGNSGAQGSLTQTVQSTPPPPPPPPTPTALASSASPCSEGAALTFTATVTGTAPTGTVGFKDGSVAISGCAAVALTGSGNARSATCSTTALTAGVHTITAGYSGDANNGPGTSPALSQTVAGAQAGTGTIVTNPYGPMTIQGATINGNTISNVQPTVTIQLGTASGAAGSYAEIDFQGFNFGPGTVFTIRSGAAGQTLVLSDTTGMASAIGGGLIAQGGNGAAAPALYLRNPGGFSIAPSGMVNSPSGLTLDTLGTSRTTGRDIVNAGTIDGGGSLTLFGANIKGGGAFKANAVLVSTFGSANNPVHGAHYLANGLQIFPSMGGDVYLTINDYGSAPQYLNFMVNGNAHVSMPSAWPGGVTLPPNNQPVPPGGVRPAGVPDPTYGASSSIFQASGSMSLVGGASNNFVFAGGIVLKSGNTLDLNGVIVNQGWTTAGQAFQGTYFESPNIVSNGGNIQVYSNNLNWVNFSTMPHAPVRTWTLVRAADGSAQYLSADSVAPHLNTYSVLIEAAAMGQCWTCLVNSPQVNMH
jgi:hypothetical protein